MAFDVDDVVSVLNELRPLIKRRFDFPIGKYMPARVDGLDLFQSVAAKAIAGLDSFRGTQESELKHWVLTIAQNAYNNLMWEHVKYQRRSVRRETVPVGTVMHVRNDVVVIAPRCKDPDPVSAAELREQCELVMSALSSLPERQYMAVRMRYVESRSYEEIAVALDCTLAAARKLVCRGLAAARVQLGIVAIED